MRCLRILLLRRSMTADWSFYIFAPAASGWETDNHPRRLVSRAGPFLHCVQDKL